MNEHLVALDKNGMNLLEAENRKVKGIESDYSKKMTQKQGAHVPFSSCPWSGIDGVMVQECQS